VSPRSVVAAAGRLPPHGLVRPHCRLRGRAPSAPRRPPRARRAPPAHPWAPSSPPPPPRDPSGTPRSTGWDGTSPRLLDRRHSSSQGGTTVSPLWSGGTNAPPLFIERRYSPYERWSPPRSRRHGVRSCAACPPSGLPARRLPYLPPLSSTQQSIIIAPVD